MNDTKNACVRAVQSGFIIESCSGYRMLFSDPESYFSFLPFGCNLEEIGKSVILALDASRKLSIQEANEFKESSSKWQNWINKMVEITGSKNEQKLLQKMALCNVKEANGEIAFSPTIKGRGAAWEGKGEESKVSVARAAGHLAIGLAFKSALEKCVPHVGA